MYTVITFCQVYRATHFQKPVSFLSHMLIISLTITNSFSLGSQLATLTFFVNSNPETYITCHSDHLNFVLSFTFCIKFMFLVLDFGVKHSVVPAYLSALISFHSLPLLHPGYFIFHPLILLNFFSLLSSSSFLHSFSPVGYWTKWNSKYIKHQVMGQAQINGDSSKGQSEKIFVGKCVFKRKKKKKKKEADWHIEDCLSKRALQI